MARLASAWPPALGLVVVLGGWELAIRWLALPPFVLPPLAQIVGRMQADAALLTGGLWMTVIEALSGFGLGALVGLAIAILLVFLPRLEAMVLPVLVAINSVPVVAYAPLALIWFGIGPASKIAMVTLAVGFAVLLNSLHGLKLADPAAMALLRSFGAGPGGIMLKLRLPGAMPSVVNGLRVGIVRSMIVAIVSEMLGAYRGIGWIIYESTQQVDFLRVWGAVVAAAFASMCLYGVLVWIDRRLVWWK